MPSKGQRGAILKDCYHQHQKHLTDPTCLSLKPQFSCLRNQNKIHDSIISCWHSPVINAIPATWELCVTLNCSLGIPKNSRQIRELPKWLQRCIEVGAVGSQRWLRHWGSGDCHCTHPACAAHLCQVSELNLLQTHTWNQTHLGPHTPQHAHG